MYIKKISNKNSKKELKKSMALKGALSTQMA
jgi:hypothetical protein